MKFSLGRINRLLSHRLLSFVEFCRVRRSNRHAHHILQTKREKGVGQHVQLDGEEEEESPCPTASQSLFVHSSSIETDVVRWSMYARLTKIGGLYPHPIHTSAYIRIFNPQFGNRMRPADSKGDGRTDGRTVTKISFPHFPRTQMQCRPFCESVGVNVIDVPPPAYFAFHILNFRVSFVHNSWRPISASGSPIRQQE